MASFCHSKLSTVGVDTSSHTFVKIKAISFMKFKVTFERTNTSHSYSFIKNGVSIVKSPYSRIRYSEFYPVLELGHID